MITLLAAQAAGDAGIVETIQKTFGLNAPFLRRLALAGRVPKGQLAFLPAANAGR